MYFILPAGEDKYGILAKNFLSMLSSSLYMGEYAAKSPRTEALFSLGNVPNERLEILPTSKGAFSLNTLDINSDDDNRVFIIVDISASNVAQDITNRLDYLNKIRGTKSKPLSVFIVGSNLELLTSEDLKNNKEKLTTITSDYQKNYPNSKVKIEDVSALSFHTGLGFPELKKNLLIDKLMQLIELFRLNRGKNPIDGLDKILQIYNNKSLPPQQRMAEIIKIAHDKKGDNDITRFLHRTVRNRQPEVEALYQLLGNMPLPPKVVSMAVLIKATEDLEHLNKNYPLLAQTNKSSTRDILKIKNELKSLIPKKQNKKDFIAELKERNKNSKVDERWIEMVEDYFLISQIGKYCLDNQISASELLLALDNLNFDEFFEIRPDPRYSKEDLKEDESQPQRYEFKPGEQEKIIEELKSKLSNQKVSSDKHHKNNDGLKLI